jgi:ribosomal protein S18 acetylase RimI-like enzyme
MKIARDHGEDVSKAIDDGLSSFNRGAIGASGSTPVNVTVRDDDGAIRGGVVGRVFLDSFHISTVWIDDRLRGQGHGKAMMELAEAEGRRHGATNVWLNTLSWQARPFYESLGYSCFGEMPVLNGTERRYFMLKLL